MFKHIIMYFIIDSKMYTKKAASLLLYIMEDFQKKTAVASSALLTNLLFSVPPLLP